MNGTLKVVLKNLKCPSCNSDLVLLEDRKFVWLGCEKCCVYVRVTKSSISKRVVGKRVFPWRDIISELIEMLYQVCQQ